VPRGPVVAPATGPSGELAIRGPDRL